EINIDFKDIQSVLSGKVTLAGMGTAQGVNRAAEAIRQALSPPSMLLNAIAEAKEILLIIQSGPEADLEMAELTSITEIICEKANKKAEVLFGHLTVANLGTSLKILVLVATDEY
ncbi:MAG: cell division protein FtsZ, partial [Adhaeribacter sp.]|nr:cell division protein FtsZ [Adhaeribacter sp.]